MYVDENGWNIDGKIYLIIVMRVRVMILVIRDEILELVLDFLYFVVVEISYENLV